MPGRWGRASTPAGASARSSPVAPPCPPRGSQDPPQRRACSSPVPSATPAPNLMKAKPLVGATHGGGPIGVGHRRDLVDLVGGEAGHLAELSGQADGGVVAFTAGAAEVEQAVDGALELEGVLAPLGVAL